MISAGAKSNIKQEEIKDLVATNYYKKYLQNFKYNELFVKKNGAGGGKRELRTYSLVNPPGIFHLLTLPQEIPDKSKL